MKRKPPGLSLILHDIRSAHNVGSMFRTADAAGVSRVYLSGVTPAPIDRFGRPRSDIAKTALGAQQTIAWERHNSTISLMQGLRAQGTALVALEQTPGAIDYRQYEPIESTALLIGSEVDGLPQDVLAHCDAVIEIPMRGKKESLNAAVAAGIALFRLLERHESE